MDIVRSKIKIQNIFEDVQTLFSLPSLLISIACFGFGVGVIGLVVLHNWKTVEVFVFYDSFYSLLMNFGPLVAVFWTAGRVPIEAKKFQDAFCKKIEYRMAFGIAIENQQIDKSLFDTSDLVFSGANVIFYRRSLVLGFAGSILTYTILLVNTNDC
ncbi:hypothetical protein JTE90_028166 [Oedothorax gibbosus]|uniref:Gustatory receptor n=1 Tax=Oedothorax gibbosus TaxID=931172 RepID=A0AAV6V8V8_9ARAC|nr:hypothetical protein JTE90_028166 [Oedothorax gibbosus]